MTAPFQSHSAASKRAAQNIAPYLKSIRYLIYMFITNNPGVTDDEIRAHLGLNHNTARPRRIELERRGLVEWTGNIRVGHLGATALTWRITGEPYPTQWNEKAQVSKTQSGEARIRRALDRAFPAPRPALQKQLNRIVAKLTKANGLVSVRREAQALKKLLTPAEFDRMLLLLIS